MAEKVKLIDAENLDKSSKMVWTESVKAAVDSCVKIKKEREKEILFDRFGIGKNPKTLHAIGQKYGVTRERIRQIVNNSIKKLKNNCESIDAKNRINTIEEIVKENGGFAAKDVVFNNLKISDPKEQNAVIFIASLSDKLYPVKESHIFKFGWASKKLTQSNMKNISKSASALLKDAKKVMSAKDIAEKIKQTPEVTQAVLSGTKNIMKTDNGRWGLTSWPQVNPKSIRDKSKYILTRHGKPIHYSELTSKISEMSNKKVTKQSVHNELIKNGDFVLVGRGIYALSEWGYEPGIVEEVIVAVLKDAKEPLHRDIIIDRVLERRIVKASTVILNLQKPRFKRVDKAVYTIN